MKERAVFLFLLAMGTIKVYENFAEEDERDEDDRSQEEVPRSQGNKGKRSIDEAIKRWTILNHDFKEEIVETSHDGIIRGRVDCGAVADDECTCRRLTCFGEMGCRKDLPGPTPETFLSCRSATLSGVTLCECKKYIPLDTGLSNHRRRNKHVEDPSPAHKTVDV